MITGFTAINEYAPLPRVLKKDIDINSNLVFIDYEVGQSHVSGRSLLNLISASLGFEKYYRENGISKWWEICGLAGYREFFHPTYEPEESVRLVKVCAVPSTRKYLLEERIDPSLVERIERMQEVSLNKKAEIKKLDCKEADSWVITFGEKSYRLDFDKNEEDYDVYEWKSGWVHCPIGKNTYALLGKMGFLKFNRERDYKEVACCSYITREFYEKLRNLRKGFCEDTPLNRWGYLKLKLNSDEPVFSQEIVPYVYEGKKYFDFNPYDDHDIRGSFYYKRKPQNNTQIPILENGIERIYRFFDKGINPRYIPEIHPSLIVAVRRELKSDLKKGYITKEEYARESRDLEHRMMRRSMEACYVDEDVQKGAQLIVFIDMPMAEFPRAESMQGKSDVINKLEELLKKYEKRLQLFITTESLPLEFSVGYHKLVF